MEEKEKSGFGVDMVNVAKGLKALQQASSLLRDTLTSEVSMLEGTIPVSYTHLRAHETRRHL
eukprot:10543556-Prorocentrum_lima.AAC.1